jgi:DNA polymerase
MFVGEAPGEQEEKQGIPFVGPAGEILDHMLAAACEKIDPRWERNQVYITNTIKCRPVDGKSNRQPELKEIAACKSILDREIALVNPKVIICVGAVAASTLIHPGFKISQEHGKIFGDKIKYMAIYHPSYILRTGENTDAGIALKLEVWEDLIEINKYLDTH